MQDNQISNLSDRIFNKKRDYNLLDIYDYLMVEYGYIPFDEFKSMDATLVNELVIRINARNEKKAKENRRSKGKR